MRQEKFLKNISTISRKGHTAFNLHVAYILGDWLILPNISGDAEEIRYCSESSCE